MNPVRCWWQRSHNRCLIVAAVAVLLPGCNRPVSDRLQGYAEGEFVYVSAPTAGILRTLSVERGAQVTANAPLFALEDTPEIATRDEIQRRITQAQATWEDLTKGRRPSEIESLEAQLKQADVATSLSEKELTRQERLLKTNATSVQDVDRARSTHEQNLQRVLQLQADLKTARLPSREDQIAAAAANIRVLEASLVKAEWDLSQKKQVAPDAALVYDTLFRVGEWVPAGRPIVSLLPPRNLKVRTFVPEGQVGTIQPRDAVEIFIDGVAEPLAGKVSYISPKAEFTPPVIYSRESRAKLVFMVEISLPPEVAAKLHPGQPVDVRLVK